MCFNTAPFVVYSYIFEAEDVLHQYVTDFQKRYAFAKPMEMRSTVMKPMAV
jgi:hypothetical protein